MEFRLSSHEVMRGITVRNGRLVLRPSGIVLLGTTLDVLVTFGLLALVLARGGFLYVFVPVIVWVAGDACARLRVAVVADESIVRVRNRWRTQSYPIESISEARVGSVEWRFRRPAYFATTNRFTAVELDMGVLDSADRRPGWCDALISVPRDRLDESSDPNPTEMKIATLNRWIGAARAAHRAT